MTDIEPSGNRPQVHIVYEYGVDYRPHSSSFLRLLRPFSHPGVRAHIDTTFDVDYRGEPADMVIVDRLWRPDVSLQLVKQLIHGIRQKGARFVYCLDDNFIDLALENRGWPSEERLSVAAYMLRQADCVLVSTSALRERLLPYNPNIYLLSNHLDERLLVIHHPEATITSAQNDHIVIGYMGTFTHDEDFMLVLPALKSIHQRFPGRIEIQVIGGIQSEETRSKLLGLPLRYVYPRPEEQEYPLFMLWFTGHVRWDIAISPLRDTPFNNCKSDIKYLDYAAIGSAGIFSQSPAYASTIHHKDNGWIAENTPEAWEEALATLIQDPSLRLKIAGNATRLLYTQRILAQRASDLVDIINLIAKT